MISTILIGVITTLCGVGIIAFFKSRWLYLITPKLYLNTPIRSDGQIVSLTITNAGFLSEEDVSITLRPVCKFELIATSKSTLLINGNTLSLSKLSRFEEVEIHLLLVGNSFDPAFIESVESKNTKGKVVSKKEEAAPIWQSFLVIPLLLMIFIVPFVLGTIFGNETHNSALGYINQKLELFGKTTQLAGFKSTVTEWSSDGNLRNALRNGRIKIETSKAIKYEDVMTITYKLTNNTKVPLMVDGYMEGSAGKEGPLSFGDSRINSFALASNETKEVNMKIFMPDSIKIKMTKSFISFQALNGDTFRALCMNDFN